MNQSDLWCFLVSIKISQPRWPFARIFFNAKQMKLLPGVIHQKLLRGPGEGSPLV